VVLHGYSDSLRSWDLLRPLLPPSLRVIALSQRGHAPQWEAPERVAADLVPFVEGLYR